MPVLQHEAGRILESAESAVPFSGPSSHVSRRTDDAIDEASREDLAQAIAATFRGEIRPAFAQQVAILFNHSNPQQRADVLNELVGSVSPAAVSRIAGGVLARALGAGDSRSIGPADTVRFAPSDVRAIAAHAARHDPSIVERLGVFYSNHPGLVRTLRHPTVLAIVRHLRSRG